MTSYCTFLIFNPTHVEAVDFMCSAAGWKIRFIADPSERFWFYKNGVTEISHPDALTMRPTGSIAGQLMVIDSDETTANNIIGLVRAANDVIEGNYKQDAPFRRGFELPDDPSEQTGVFCDVFRSHGFSDSSEFLGPYEVFNVESLARRLILSKAQLWNVSTDDILRRTSSEN